MANKKQTTAHLRRRAMDSYQSKRAKVTKVLLKNGCQINGDEVIGEVHDGRMRPSPNLDVLGSLSMAGIDKLMKKCGLWIDTKGKVRTP